MRQENQRAKAEEMAMATEEGETLTKTGRTGSGGKMQRCRMDQARERA